MINHPFVLCHSIVNSYFQYQSSTRVLDNKLDRVLEPHSPSHILTQYCMTDLCFNVFLIGAALSSDVSLAEHDRLTNSQGILRNNNNNNNNNNVSMSIVQNKLSSVALTED